MEVGDEGEERLHELLGERLVPDDRWQLRLNQPYIGREQPAKMLYEGFGTRRRAPALRESRHPFLRRVLLRGGRGGCRAG